MCGIAGIYRLGGPGKMSRGTLLRMVGALSHRGPDEFGAYLDDRVALGHARLSIIDLAGGSQPIHNEDQTLWIVFNGEIFNHVELRADLVRRGHSFYTASDTEVIVHAYEDEGSACVHRFNGQFAFAIWDSRRQRLFIARDRLGIRPLHYAVQGDTLVFASEIKALFTAGIVDREIDPLAMEQIFTFWTSLPGRTAFKDVAELPAGCTLAVADGAVSLRSYWRVPFCAPTEQLRCPIDDLKADLIALLKDSIRIRLRADVPVGCYLSGGLDSSAVTALVVRHFNNEVRTFGLRFEDADFDEGQHQREMVEFLNVRHEELLATDGIIGQSFADTVWHCEKPILRTAPIPLFLLSQLVRDTGYKVVLTGEGADELFGGYNIFREAKIRAFMARDPKSKIRPLLLRKLYPYIFHDDRSRIAMQSFFARGLDRIHDPLFSHLIRWDNTSRLKAFFSRELREAIGAYSAYDELRGLLPPDFQRWDQVTKAQYLETWIFLTNYLLSSQGDRVAMAHSVEMRLPYLDYRVVELACRIPSRLKVAGLNEKHILKRCFAGVLPDRIVGRAKHPYRAPIRNALLHPTSVPFVEELLSPAAVAQAGLFDAAKVQTFLRRQLGAGTTSEVDGMALSGLLSTQWLHRQYVQEFDPGHAQSVVPRVLVDRRSGRTPAQP